MLGVRGDLGLFVGSVFKDGLIGNFLGEIGFIEVEAGFPFGRHQSRDPS